MSGLMWPNGFGETTGDALASTLPFYQAFGNDVWFVCSLNGTDGASPAGKNKEKPLATLGQANTNAASGDIIVLLTGHTETFTAALTITKSLTIIGCGTTSGKPSPQLKNNSAAASMVTLATANIDVEFRNVYFPAQVQSNSATKFNYTAGSLRMEGCYCEASGNDTAAVITLPTSGIERFDFINSTMVSTGSSTSSQPLRGISGTSITGHVRLDGAVFDDGTYGWSGDTALLISQGSTGGVRGTGVSLLRGASIAISNRSWVQVGTATGGGRVT